MLRSSLIKHRGHIRDICFRDIQVLDGKFPFSVINGSNDAHLVENVTFENIKVQGKQISSKNELKPVSKYAKNIKIN